MNKVITFQINGSQRIDFRIENCCDKLHPYNDLEIEYCKSGERVLLYSDFLLEGIVTFKNVLSKALGGELQLHHSLVDKGIGFAWNEWAHNLEEIYTNNIENVVEKYWLWSTTSSIGNQTWMYNFSDKIFIEISRSYSGHFGELNADEIPFDVFIKNYKPVAVIRLDKMIVKHWIKDCVKIISDLEKIK